MARNRATTTKTSPLLAATRRASVTSDRFVRLHRLLQMLAAGPQTRSMLSRRLKLDVRGFYRDLEALRDAGIPVLLERGRYHLTIDVSQAIGRLPFPDPHLTLGEALQLARGRTAAHTQLKQLIERLTS